MMKKILTAKELFEVLVSRSKPLLDLSPDQAYKPSQEIDAREVATIKSIAATSVDDMLKLQGCPGLNVLKETFNTLYILKLIPKLSGLGIEMGSGSAALSRVILEIQENSKIDGIIALEIIKTFGEKAIPRLKSEMQLELQNKIVPAFGSFNSVAVANSTFDFGIQIESFHHSDDLTATIKETHRILKSNSFFVSIDRSWIDSISETTIQELLNHEYSASWLNQKGFPQGIVRTRRQNGEHEYRDKEWIEAFESAGFTLVQNYFLIPQIQFRDLLKRFLGICRFDRFFGIQVSARKGLFRTFIYRVIFQNPTSRFSLIEVEYPRPLQLSIWRKT